jgi:hypothetical protein
MAMGVLPAAVRALGRDALVWRVGVLQAQAAKVVSERKARAATLARRPRLDRVAQGHSPRNSPRLRLSTIDMALRAAEWRKLPTSLTELCIDTSLRCGQSFRYTISVKQQAWHI